MTAHGQLPPPAGYNLPGGVTRRQVNGPAVEPVTCPCCGEVNDPDADECADCGYDLTNTCE